MKENLLDLNMLTSHGKANTKIINDTLNIWTTHSITSLGITDFSEKMKRHYVSLPGKYHLPLRIDMTIKLDFPAFFLFIGDGHLTFASQGGDNHKIEDIIKHSGKPNQDHNSFENSLPLGEYVEISVIYNLDEMQIIIGGEERFYSSKQAYMKAKNQSDLNAEGFALGLAVSKQSTLSIKRISVTEFESKSPIIRDTFEEVKLQPAKEFNPKPTFESVISELPQEFQDKLMEMDCYMKSLNPLKFKRTVAKGGNKISYVCSDYGISYAIETYGTQFNHCLNWYIVHNGKPETWHRKADYMEEILVEIAKTNPNLSERIFDAFIDCLGCYGPRCLAKTLYEYNGQKRLTCHGRVLLRMCENDLLDAKEFFHHLNLLIERKTANGEGLPEKILLVQNKAVSSD